MPTVLLLVHGFPPRENAGTEQHAATLAAGLVAAGVSVWVVAATRAPGQPHGARWDEQVAVPWGQGTVTVPVTRVVNNLTVRPLSAQERDPALEGVLRAAIAAHRPALVHVQHLQFLTSNLKAILPDRVPYVMTLHDRWMWCPAGGLGLLPGGESCAGPTPSRCAPCAAAWAPAPGRRAGALLRLAAALGPVVRVDRLHRLYQKLPPVVRAPIRRGGPVEAPTAAAARAAAFRGAAAGAALRLSPSQHLAGVAEAQGMGPVTVLPHGVSLAWGPAPPRRQGLIFLGTLSTHKGPDLVQAAWEQAFPSGSPTLRMHGPRGDAPGLRAALVGPPLDRAGVAAALRGAEALVLGSRWEENAPLVVLEARAAGCPVIAPRSGGLPELIVEGQDGWLYPPGDQHALASVLRRFVSGPPMRPVAPPTAEDNVAAHLAVYSSVLGAAVRR